MKLAEFAALTDCPRRRDGRPLAISSLADHLKGWEETVKQGPPEGTECFNPVHGNHSRIKPSHGLSLTFGFDRCGGE